jgi:hypothetical protein
MTLHVVGDAMPAKPARQHRLPVPRTRPGFLVALAVTSVAVAACQRWYVQAAYDPVDVWLGFALSATFWSWLCLGCHAAVRFLPRVAALAVTAALGVVFYLSLGAELAYTYFYKIAEDRELSLLCVGLWPGLRVLFGGLLTARGIMVLAGLVSIAHLAALLWTWRGPALPRTPFGWAAPVALTLATGLAASLVVPRIRSPLADLGRELAFLATTPRLSSTSAPKLGFDPRSLDKASLDDPTQAYSFDYVLVFVMETMIARDFEVESSRLPPETFVHRALPQTHRYGDYHSNNQDSRTGMLDMLQSRVIPYEAYADGVDHYKFVSQLPSMVNRFNARGYETAYVVSHADREDVFADLAWKHVLLLPAAEVDALRSQMLCVTVYEFEYGCEDRAMLPKIFRVLDENPKAFVFQEFIWGHDPEYNEISGRSNADYYSTYLDAVVEHLRQTDKLDRTLIVLTADHGYRGRSTLTENFAYHIPLWFYSTRFSAREDQRLFSHISFQGLLLHEMGVAPAPTPEPFIVVVGPTGIRSVTVLDAAGELALIRTRGDANFLLARNAAPGRSDFALEPAAYARLLEDYRAHFDALDPQH